ncbi:unnamed protein product [Phytophthora lilii]|uniref:Unnamed protein product n=1 Tax=Phytophthora lilii TaxID=2077276 RepID=A0A9W6TXC8_9STRA|nr:unnamed protein product [Phytophthora lilii]
MANATTLSILIRYAHASTTLVNQAGEIIGLATNFSVLNTSAPTLPGLPPAPTLSISTGGMINVTLLSPEDTDFLLYWDGEKMDGDLYVKTTSTVNYLQIVEFVSVSNLKPETSYNISAVALNSLSLCNFYKAITGPEGVYATTKPTPPEAPRMVPFRITGGGITMTLIDPHDTGGNDIQIYRLYYKRNVVTEPWQLSYVGPKHQATVAHLKPLTEYAFLASVNNGYYESVNSSVKVVRTISESPPGSCEPVTLVNSTGGMMEVSWDYPADDGGSRVIGFIATIASHLDGSGRTQLSTNATSCVFYRLLADSSYDVVVRANNSYGYGPDSTIATFSTKSASPPEGKIDVTVQITTGGAAEISFDEPIDLGGVTPSDMTYNVYLDRDNVVNMSYLSLMTATVSIIGGTRRMAAVGHRRLEISSTFSNVIVGGMDPETLYGIQIRPTSQYARGGLSLIFPVETTGATIPSVPVELTREAVTGGSVLLSWGEPTDSGGLPLDGYSLFISDKTKDGPFTAVYSDVLRTATISQLKPNSKYWVYATAQNDVGDSPPSEIVLFTTRSVTAPSAPQNLNILSVGFESIECSWALPRDIGGDAIENYIVTATTTTEPITSVTFTTPNTQGTLTSLRQSQSFSISVVKCDHDYVEIIDATTEERLWKGGCQRTGRFVYQTPSSVIIIFKSDDSVTKKGFQMQYEIDGTQDSTQIPPPGNGIPCSGHGRILSDGTCKCSVGFTGEGCNNHIICCSDPQRCHHPICELDPKKVIVVSGDFGDDEQGTGQIMDGSEKGTASKAVKTLARAVEISSAGTTILVYPGVYSGLLNRDLEILSTNITITTLKGPFWTSINCESSSRFLYSSLSVVIVEGLALYHCEEVNGGALNIAASDLTAKNVLITDSSGKQEGGAIYASGSNVTLHQVKVTKSSAGTEGGGMYLKDSKAVMVSSNITKSTADRGGAVVLRGYSSLTTTESTFEGNTALKSGGGIFANGVISLNGIALSNNKAPSGGGVAMDSGMLTMVKCIVRNNSATDVGGGVSLTGTTTLVALATSIEINDAATTGGGVYLSVNGAGLSIVDSYATLRGINVKNGYADESGGGVMIVDSIAKWSNVVAQFNKAQQGGGLFLVRSQLTCEGSVFLSNNTADDGGAIWINTSSMTGISGTYCLSNTAANNGGAMFIVGDSIVQNIKQEMNDAPRGGCMHVKNATLHLESSVILKCTANIAGGGIWATTSQINISNVSVNGCTAPHGGGLFAETSSISGGVTVEACKKAESGGGMYLTGETVVVGAKIIGGEAREGGAAYVVNANLDIENSMFSSSYASEKGGGICAINATIKLEKTGVVDDRSDLLGGGIYLRNSSVAHRDVAVERCNASIGGGLYLIASDVFANTQSSSSQVSANEATDSGGNVFLSASSSIKQLVVSLGKADDGGGVTISSGTSTLQDCFIEKNHATFGGGVSIQSGSSCIFLDSVVSINAAVETGGGMNVANAAIWHNGLSVLSNTAPLGAGIFVTGNSQLEKQSDGSSKALIQYNRATSKEITKGFGGGIYIAPASEVSADGLAFLNGEASRGAGVYVDGATFALDDALFQEGNASSGGGIYANYVSTVDLTNCSFVANNASQSGGAIGSGGVQGGSNTIIINNCSLTANLAGIGGGLMLSLTNINGSDTILTENKAKSGGAVAVLSEGSVNLSNWKFVNNSVVKNEVGVQGGSLYITKGDITISNSQLISHDGATLALNGGLIYVENPDTKVAIINSLLSSGQAYSGGSIYSVNADVSIKKSTLNDAFAYDFGAGIFAVGSVIEILHTTFHQNFAFYDGGGIYMTDGGQLLVDNSSFSNNSVQDRGGAIFLSPGAAVEFTVFNSNFSFNTNAGFGSTIFVGRKNTAQLSSCLLTGNGDENSEGGTLSVVDAVVNIEDCVIEFNTATKGAGVQISRSANVTFKRTIIRNNSASEQGGALHASIRAVATFFGSTIVDNNAEEGGAVYAMGASSITLTNSNFADNAASSFGGAVSMRGSTILVATGSLFNGNNAYTGGAVSIQGNASLSASNVQFQNNAAVDFGAGIYINKDIESDLQIVVCKDSRFGGNIAVAGNDTYWVYYPWFTFSCTSCSSLSEGNEVMLSSSSMAITPGWWPVTVTSGVSIGVEVPDNSSSESVFIDAATRRLLSSPTSSDQDSILSTTLNASLVRPGSNVLWPTIVVRDYYGAIATYDNTTRCRAAKSTGEEGTFSFSPSTWITVDEGYIIFNHAQVLSRSRDSPYQLNISCTLSTVLESPIVVNVTVDKCNRGYENVNGLDGEKCYSCPPGASCEQKDQDGITTGVIFPRRQQGYFLSKTRSTFNASSCADPESWASDDPCKTIEKVDLTARIHACATKYPETFEHYWSHSRVYCCLSGQEYYSCDVSMIVPAMLPMIVAVAALVFLCYLFSNAAEQRVVNQAQAAKKFQIYRAQSRTQAVLRAAKARIQRHARIMMDEVAARANLGGTAKPHLFHIKPKAVQVPPWRPEKFKIMLGFFQIIGSFKEVYEIPWPDSMSSLMDICSLADFNFVDTTAAECLFKRNYFTNYR